MPWVWPLSNNVLIIHVKVEWCYCLELVIGLNTCDLCAGHTRLMRIFFKPTHHTFLIQFILLKDMQWQIMMCISSNLRRQASHWCSNFNKNLRVAITNDDVLLKKQKKTTWVRGLNANLEANGDDSTTNLFSHHELLTKHGQDEVFPAARCQPFSQPHDPLPTILVRFILYSCTDPRSFFISSSLQFTPKFKITLQFNHCELSQCNAVLEFASYLP